VLALLLAVEGGAGRGHHDGPAGAVAAVVAGDHVAHRLLGREERAVEVHPHDPPPLVLVHPHEARRPPGHPGVHEARVDPAQLVDGPGGRRDHGVVVAHVAHDRQHPVPVRLEPGGGGGVLVRVRAPDRDVRAVRGERLGHAEADAAVAPGDQGDVAGQVEQLGGRHGPNLGRDGACLRGQG